MEIAEVAPEAYKQYFTHPYQIFASADFNKLNAAKCEMVYYLVFKDKKVRLGLIGGIRNGIFLSPFSAPFGGFIAAKEDIKIQDIDKSLEVLNTWALEKGLKAIQITLPPDIYMQSYISKLQNCLYRSAYKIKSIDLNYAFSLNNFDENYTENIWRNARKNLKRSLKSGLEFEKCKTLEEKSLAYQVIKINRTAKGFPLRMSWEQVQETVQWIPADFFLVIREKQPVASAMVFHVAKNVVQVVYWGDDPAYANLKTMNFLSYKVFEFYKNLGVKYIDIGPSTENSIPNYGLCEFKEGIGCDISPKYTYLKEF